MKPNKIAPPPDKSDWWPCVNGCGFCDPFRYGKKMREHEATCTYAGTRKVHERTRPREDCVHNYALVLTQMCLLFLAFRDCSRFGNGPLAVDMYKWIFVLGRDMSSWSKYAPVALYLWACVNILLSPQMAHRVVWDRTCCAHNAPGRNIQADRRLEHVNWPTKTAIKRMGHQNLTQDHLDEIGRSVLTVHDACRNFDKINGVARPSSTCSSSSRQRVNKDDEAKMLKLLLEAVSIIMYTILYY